MILSPQVKASRRVCHVLYSLLLVVAAPTSPPEAEEVVEVVLQHLASEAAAGEVEEA